MFHNESENVSLKYFLFFYTHSIGISLIIKTNVLLKRTAVEDPLEKSLMKVSPMMVMGAAPSPIQILPTTNIAR